jgi:hypothetical protein
VQREREGEREKKKSEKLMTASALQKLTIK